MDLNGRAYWAQHNDICSTNLGQVEPGPDGEVDVVRREVSTSEFYPSSISFSITGRFVAVTGGDEFSIFSALAWRVKGFGEGGELAWGPGDAYAVRVSGGSLAIHRGFGAAVDFAPPHDCDRLFGGRLLGVAGDDAITFCSWADLAPVRRIDVRPRGVWWAPLAPLVAIATAGNLFVLAFNEDAAAGSAFTLVADREVAALGGWWHNEVFFFNDERSVSFLAGGHFEVAARLEKALTLVGYVPRAQAVFLLGADGKFYRYNLPLDVVNFMLAAAAEGEIETEKIPPEWRARMCGLLEAFANFEGALQLADSDEKRFELALKMENVETAARIARASGAAQQWHQLAGIALRTGRIGLLDECLTKAGDEVGSVLLRAMKGNAAELEELADRLEADSKNVAFTAYFAAGQYGRCIDLLLQTGKQPEAAMMARAYAPARMEECARKWKEALTAKGEQRIAETIALPSEYPNLFGIVPHKEDEADMGGKG
jgi:coatomer subunit beta'